MYTKDKACRITLRLNEAQFEFVKENADFIGVSPSEFLRMVVNTTMASTRAITKTVKEINEKGKAEGRENDKANIDNIVQP